MSDGLLSYGLSHRFTLSLHAVCVIAVERALDRIFDTYGAYEHLTNRALAEKIVQYVSVWSDVDVTE